MALGVLDAWMWARKPKGEADVLESLRWTEGYERVAELAAEAGHAADYLVRARHDRALADGGRLRAEVERQAPLGEVEFRLPPAPGRKERTVTQTVRVARVELARRGGETREVTAILAREESPPPGEKPVEWLLLTNEVVETLDEACLRVAWYRKRWLVEIFSRILESGCQVEALQLAARERPGWRSRSTWSSPGASYTWSPWGATARNCRATWPSQPRSGGPPGWSPSASRRPRRRPRWARWSASSPASAASWAARATGTPAPRPSGRDC